jgi:hypothetical protein
VQSRSAVPALPETRPEFYRIAYVGPIPIGSTRADLPPPQALSISPTHVAFAPERRVASQKRVSRLRNT